MDIFMTIAVLALMVWAVCATAVSVAHDGFRKTPTHAPGAEEWAGRWQ
jgi:hypothetical protein